MAKYLLVVDQISPVEAQALAKGIAQQGLNWWHWMAPVWLLIDPQGRGTAHWRDFARSTAPSASILVVDVGFGADWSAYLPQNTHKWLHDNWT